MSNKALESYYYCHFKLNKMSNFKYEGFDITYFSTVKTIN